MRPGSRPLRRPDWVRLLIVLHAGLALTFVLLWVNLARQGGFWRADYSAFYLGWCDGPRRPGRKPL